MTAFCLETYGLCMHFIIYGDVYTSFSHKVWIIYSSIFMTDYTQQWCDFL